MTGNQSQPVSEGPRGHNLVQKGCTHQFLLLPDTAHSFSTEPNLYSTNPYWSNRCDP